MYVSDFGINCNSVFLLSLIVYFPFQTLRAEFIVSALILIFYMFMCIAFKRSVLLDIKYRTETDMKASVANRKSAVAVARRKVSRSVKVIAPTSHAVLT